MTDQKEKLAVMRSMGIRAVELERGDISELESLVIVDGEIRPIPAEQAKRFSDAQLLQFMHEHALYVFPTTELVEWLQQEIEEGEPDLIPDAIEICSGNGWLAKALEIPATDSYLQDREDIKQMYDAAGTPRISYGGHVERLDAVSAVKKYQPRFVIAAYATVKWGEGKSRSQGNMYGVDTRWVINHCYSYILIGCDSVHANDKAMLWPHERFTPPWLIVRCNSSTQGVIYRWTRKQYQ